MRFTLRGYPDQSHLQIVSADRSLVNEQRVDEVEIPGSEGYFGVLPGHTALLALLGAGELWYRKGQEKFYLSVAFGFAEVLPDRVTILAQIAERADEIDVSRAEAAKKRAEQRLATSAVDVDFERARIAMLKSLTRIQVAARDTRPIVVTCPAKLRSSVSSGHPGIHGPAWLAVKITGNVRRGAWRDGSWRGCCDGERRSATRAVIAKWQDRREEG